MAHPLRRTVAAVAAILTTALLYASDTGPAGGPVRAPGRTAPVADSARTMDAYLSDAADMYRFSGAVLVARGTDVLLAKGYGLADISTGTPNTPHTRYRIASVTKQFTALAILRLQELRRLKVTDPVCRFVRPCPHAWKPITIEHLLTHTSGIPNFTERSDIESVVTTHLSPEELVGLFRDEPLDHPAGSRWRYSNSGYALLGYIVERVTGGTYADFLDRQILGPLGLSETGYDVNHPGPQTHAVGYYPFRTPAPFHDMSIAYAAGALYSTVTDLYRWNRFLLTGTPRIIGADALAQMFTPRAAIDPDRPDLYGWYCYGLGLLGENADATYSHSGGINGFSSFNLLRPHHELSVTVLSNQQTDRTDVIADKLATIVDP